MHHTCIIAIRDEYNIILLVSRVNYDSSVALIMRNDRA